MLEIYLFGDPEVHFDQKPLRLARRKSRALLYYLAAQQKPQRREHLQALFWPEAEKTSAQQLLRTAIYGLRSTLVDAIESGFETVFLKGDTWVDSRTLERSTGQTLNDPASLLSALKLYRGEFLEDFSLPDSIDYDTWMITERERYRVMVSRGWVALNRLYQQKNDPAEALKALDRALAFDPLQEDLQREAIRLAYLTGDRPESIRRYDELRKLLDEELGVPPMLETRKLYDKIVNDELPASQPEAAAVLQDHSSVSRLPARVEELPFTGRIRELEVLRDAASSGKLALIEGEPGIGKTRLAEEYTTRLGSLLVQGAAHELEQNLPYQPVTAALRSLITAPGWPGLRDRMSLSPVWRSELRRLVPELFSAPAPVIDANSAGAESRLWEAVYQLLVSVSQLKQVVVFIDDLQWADGSTLGLLGYLARQPKQEITLLATARPITARTPAAALIQSLTRVDQLVRLQLSRLSALEVHQASGKLTYMPNPMLTQWLAERSEGNPYVLVELVRYLRGQGVIQANGDLDADRLSKTPVVPPTVYSLVANRLAELSETSQRVLDAAVAAGRDFELDVAGHAAGLSPEAALDAADELLAVGLIKPILDVKPDGSFNRYSFDHNLIMEVAYRDAGEARHRLMHRRVGEAIELLHRRDLDSWAGVLAFHFQETGDLDKAARYAYLAGKRAARLSAWKEATAFFEQALQGQATPTEEREIWAALGEVRILAGEASKASQAYEHALNLSEPGSRESFQMKLELGYTYLLQARYKEAVDLAREVLQAGQSDASQAEFLWGTALSLEGADLVSAGEHLRLAEKYSNLADTLRLAEIKFEQGSVAAQQGGLQEAVGLYQQSLSLAQQAYSNGESIEKALRQVVLAYNNLAYHSLLLDGPAAQTYAEAGMQLAREKGAVSLLPYLYSTTGEIQLMRGLVDEAKASFRQGLELAERINVPERIAGLSANLGLAAVKKGDVNTAIQWLTKAKDEADALGTRHLSAQIRIWLAPLLPANEARAALQEARAIAEKGGRQRLLEEIREVEKLLL